MIDPLDLDLDAGITYDPVTGEIDLPEDVVDDQLSPGLRVPDDAKSINIAVWNKAKKENDYIMGKEWTEVVRIDSIEKTPGNPDDARTQYGHEKVVIASRVDADANPLSVNKGRWVQRQYLDFFLKLVPIEFDMLKARREAVLARFVDWEHTPEDLKHVLLASAFKSQTLRAMKLFSSLVRAAGYPDRLVKGKFIRSFVPISDLMANKGAGFTSIPILAIIQKGRPGREEGSEREEIVRFEQA